MTMVLHRSDRRILGRLTDDVAWMRHVMVNLFFVDTPDPRGWVLIDAGLRGATGQILQAAEQRYGRDVPPTAIILTHGHFDHVGAVGDLIEMYDVPVYAHPLEMPYLTGRSSYPPPDPTVGGGAMAALSFMYPRGPYDFGDHIQPLPDDGTIPALPGWRWIFTPGHSPGHISLFRERDGLLIAGDAVTTTKQESASAVMSQRLELHGPPSYFTIDWQSARMSVEELASLSPRILATGHGQPIAGEFVADALRVLARDFDREVPSRGRYVRHPARCDERGVCEIPPPVVGRGAKIAVGLGLGAATALLLAGARRRY